jgi:hypothetical protein
MTTSSGGAYVQDHCRRRSRVRPLDAGRETREWTALKGEHMTEGRSTSTLGAQPAASKKLFWAGWGMSALPVLLLLFSGVMKLIKPATVVEGFVNLGYPESLSLGIGIAELTSVVLYAIPRTSVLGAILLTGYLGGATATHLRIGEPFFMAIILGVLVWGGLYLRDDRLRALIPLRS